MPVTPDRLEKRIAVAGLRGKTDDGDHWFGTLGTEPTRTTGSDVRDIVTQLFWAVE